MEIEVKDRATSIRKLYIKFKDAKDPAEVMHSYRFDAPVDVYVDGVLTPIPDPPVPPTPPPTKDDIYQAIFADAFATGGDALVEKVWGAFDAVSSFGQALEVMDYSLALKRGRKLKSTGKLSQEETDMVLSHVPEG